MKKIGPNKSSRHGYVLVTTVMVMALISLLLVGIANQSMRLVTSAVLEEEALQSRWASISVQHAILRNSKQILNYNLYSSQLKQARVAAETAEENDDTARDTQGDDIDWRQDFPTYLRFQLPLNGHLYQFLLADENCKVNLEKLHQRRSADEALSVLSVFLQSNPDVVQQRGFDSGSWKTWGQLLLFEDRQHLMGGVEQATSQVTLWSNGKINYLRCSDKVFRAGLEATLLRNEARKLVELRQEHPTWELNDLLTVAAIADDKRQQIRGWFLSDERSLGDSQEPNTFSLWMRSDSQRDLQFHVIATTAKPQHLSFEW